MATLNGVEFTIESIDFPERNQQSAHDFPSTNDQQISHYGYPGLNIAITAAVYTLADADSLLDELLKQGVQTLVLDTGWQYDVYTVSYNMPDSFGIQEHYFTFNLQFITETPYKKNTTLTTRAKTITTNNQTWSADDSANDIDTDGTADTTPDIAITAGTSQRSVLEQDQNDDSYSICNGAAYIDILQNTYNTTVALDGSNAPGQTINLRKAGAQIIYYFSIYIASVTVGGNVTCSYYDHPGGTLIDSDTVLVTSTGQKYFDMVPLAVRVSNEPTCSDNEGNQGYIEITTVGTMTIRSNTTSVYADGSRYNNGTIQSGDLFFEVQDARPVIKVEQTFQLTEAATVSTIVLKLCKYNYAGSYPVACYLKEGATVLGTGSAVLTGSSFSEVSFALTPGPGSLDLAASTTYEIEIYPPTDSTPTTSILIATEKSNVVTSGGVTLTDHLSATYTPTHDIFFKLLGTGSLVDVDVYNTSDTGTKCRVCDEAHVTATHRINEDGTGEITFSDDFTTNKYLKCSTTDSVTYDDPNNELDIADGGYIYWKFNTSPYPIRNHPNFTATIDITAGTPTIQISEDGSTWYDIDTAIVDNVSTVYDLKSTGNLVLKKKSLFYVRVDCTATGTHTCSLKTVSLSIDLMCIDAELPVVEKGGAANTFRCDQGSESGIDCTATLYYRDLKWGG